MPSCILSDLDTRAGPGVIVECNRPDLPALVARAALSISQAGYNTVAELLMTRTPSVVVPFEGGIETEHCWRADLLAERGHLEAVPEADWTPNHLDRAMQAALVQGRRSPGGIRLDGSARSAAILRDMADSR